MAKTLVEKFEQILAADPASMVFVELAKALLEKGQYDEAAAVCRRGVEHHPDSILGRVLLGRSLLSVAAAEEAELEFDRALAVDPENPYGYNLVAESLLKAQRFAQALPVLERALLLQPSDLRLQQWLAQVQASAGGRIADDQGEGQGADWGPAAPSDNSHIDPLASLHLDLADLDSPPQSPAAAAPVAPPPLPARPPRADGKPRVSDLLLADLPEPGRSRPAPEPALAPTLSEVTRIARNYEDTLRHELEATKQAPKSLLRRFWLPATLLGTALLGAGVLWVGTRVSQQRYAERHASDFINQAQQGLLQATRPSLSGAAHLMAELLQVNPHRLTAIAVAVQAQAMTCSAFGCPAADRQAAEAQLAELNAGLAASAQPAGASADAEAALTAQVFLAADPAALADAVLAVPVAEAGPWIHFLAGSAWLARHNEAEALKRFELGLKLAPGHVPMLVAVGDDDLQRGEAARAADIFALARNASPLNVPAAVGAAEAHLALHAGPEVTADDERVFDQIAAAGAAVVPSAWRQRLDFAQARILAVNGKLAAALTLLNEGMAQHGDEFVAYEGALSDCYAADGQYDRAETEAWRALSKSPKDPEALGRYGEVLLARDRPRELLQRIAALPGNRHLHVLRARAGLAAGNLPLARAEIEATRKDNKVPALAGVLLAEVQLREGHSSEGRAALKQIAALAHPPAEAFLGLATVDAAGEAIADARRALEIDPRAYEAHCTLGRLLAHDGRPADRPEAAAELQAAIRLDQQHLESRLALGSLELETGKASAAKPLLEAAVRLAPLDVPANLALARALLALGENTEAVRAAARATKAAPQDPQGHHWLGKVALAAGDRKLAVKELKQAKRLDKTKDRSIAVDLALAARTR